MIDFLTQGRGRRISTLFLAVLPLVVIAILVFVFMGKGEVRTLSLMFVTLTMVIGLGVFSGNSGVVSLGHMSFVGMGAYFSGLMTTPVQTKAMMLPHLPSFLAELEISLLPALIITLCLVAILAFITGLPIVRMGEASAVISTLGLLLIFHSIVVGASDYTRGSNAFLGVPRETGIWSALAIAVIAVIVARLFKDSKTGLEIRAARDNTLAAQSIGINVHRGKLRAWVLSAMISAAGGVMLGHFLGAFSPTKFYFDDTLIILAMLIVGGMHTVTGAIAGTLLVTLVVEVLRRVERGGSVFGFEYPEMFGLTMSGVCLLILGVMYWRRSGLFGRFELDELLFPFKKIAAVSKVETNPTAQTKGNIQLTVTNLSKAFSGVQAIDNVSFEVGAGEIVGLIGPNGAGKTTLINLIMGATPPDSGHVTFKSRKLTELSTEKIAPLGLARTFQNIRLFNNFSVRQNVEIAARSVGIANTQINAERTSVQLMAEMGLTEVANNPADSLAYGQRRLLEIARALALQPDILLLDEPAAGMNPSETAELITAFRKIRDDTGAGILIVEHDLHLIMRLCDRLVVLNKGEVIASGTPLEIQKNSKVIEAYLGPNFTDNKGE